MASATVGALKNCPRVMRVVTRLNVGGVARHVAWLTSGLRGAGFDSVLVTGSVPPGEADMTAFVSAEGVQPVVIPAMSRGLSPLKDLRSLWELYRLLIRLKPDVIHTHTAKAGALGRAAAWLYRWLTPSALWGRPRCCRVLHTFHGHVFRGYFGRWKTWLFVYIERLLARWATDRILVLSPQQYQEIHGEFRIGRDRQVTVVPLGLDLERFASASARRGILRAEMQAAETEVLVGIVGRLTEVKNHSLFLRVAALWRQQQAESAGPRVRFLIIGDGHLRASLEKSARDLGLADDLLFLGMREDPENFYAGLDIVALTSDNEGTPLSLIEAMSTGRCVISTDAGGTPDLLGDLRQCEQPEPGYSVRERGVLVETRDAATFCRGLGRLVKDHALRAALGASGRAFVRDAYPKERLIEEVAEIYRSLLSPAADRPRAARPALVAETAFKEKGELCGC